MTPLTYDVLRAIRRAAIDTTQPVAVQAVSIDSGLPMDQIRGVAQAEKGKDAPLMIYRVGRDDVAVTTDGMRAYEEWTCNPVILETGVRRWIERARWQEIPGAVIPSGGTIRGGRPNGVESLLVTLLMVKFRADRGIVQDQMCRRCGRSRRKSQFRAGRRICRQCESAQRAEREVRP